VGQRLAPSPAPLPVRPLGGVIDRSENGCRAPAVVEASLPGMIQRVKDVLIGVRPYAAGTETIGLVGSSAWGRGR
jgi:hypothetical protein